VKILESIARVGSPGTTCCCSRVRPPTRPGRHRNRSCCPLSRISRDTFRPAALLSADELAKDYVQVTAAAKLLEAMKR
jgi:hypothetical protein